ncbi:MAG: hypothetical protein LC114_19275, partial [Bryobacterales bacterium]|nr:hypothetical protein [Bryobacterales bacterium]
MPTGQGSTAKAGAPGDSRPPEQKPPRPWRTEGVPQGQPPSRRPSWTTIATFLLGYAILFGILTIQDSMNGPRSIPYTEFKAQVANKNVREIFARGDSIEGELRKAAPVPVGEDLPGQPSGKPGATYEKFTTERPTFAADDLLTELAAGNAIVRATPLIQQRGPLTNLLISVAPFLLLILFYVWMAKRQGAAMGGLFGGGPRKPVDRESVRVNFGDVAGIDEVEAEINEVVDFLRYPEKYRQLGARAPKGVLLAGAPGTGK